MDKKYLQYQQAKEDGLMALSSYKRRNEGLYKAFRTFDEIDAGRLSLDSSEVSTATRTAYKRWKRGLAYTVDGEPRIGSIEARIGSLTTKQAKVAFELSEAYEGSRDITANALEYAEKLRI